MFCVYRHTAPDGRVYIGITSQKPQARWQGGNGYKSNSYFTRAIQKYGWENFTHNILFCDLSESEAKQKEIELISEHKSNIRKYGFNISSGGESKKGTKISDWQKKRISEASKGRVVSLETRKKLSQTTKNHWNDIDYRNHMRDINTGINNPQYGKARTEEERKIRGAQTVLQYDMNNNFIAEYISIHFASEQTGVSRDVISKCCKGVFKQGKGYIWKYKP